MRFFRLKARLKWHAQRFSDLSLLLRATVAIVIYHFRHVTDSITLSRAAAYTIVSTKLGRGANAYFGY
jgi:hypothetical protein